MHDSCAVCSSCCSGLVISAAEFGVAGGVHVVGVRCQVFSCLCCWLLLVWLLEQLLLLWLLLAVAVILQRITVTDVNVLDLVAQVCLRCHSEEATAEDGGEPARHADGEAAGLVNLSIVVLADASGGRLQGRSGSAVGESIIPSICKSNCSLKSNIW